jgi:hypothetical protein
MNRTLRRIGRIAIPSLAFLPIVLVAMRLAGLIQNSFIFKLCAAALFPASFVAVVARYFLQNDRLAMAAGAVTAIAWSAFIAYLFHKLALLITAEDFSWSSFWVGLLLGSLPGALAGWRVWIRSYQQVSLPACSAGGALIGGIALGVYMGSRWSKALYH